MKKTVILIIAAMMALPVSYAYATEAQTSKEMIQKKPKKQKAEVKEVTFLVHLHCENCVAKVFDNMSRAKGVKDLEVSLEHQTVAIKYDSSKTSEEVLKTTIEKLGYPVSGKADKGHQHNHEGHDHGHDHGHKH
jgi:copper chaperone CopZ